MSRASFFALAAVVIASVLAPARAQRPEQTRFKSGNIEVRQGIEHVDRDTLPAGKLVQHRLFRDQIDFGFCFDDAKYRRMAATYYHPQGPVGVALAKFNWFPWGPVTTYAADARLPASLIGLGAPTPSLNLPLTQLVAVWSEPPIAVIGMNAGTPASYARPFQHLHFYEPTKEIIELNEGKKQRFFHFIPDARERGVQIRVSHGNPRQKLRDEGPRKFYHLMILEACSGENGEKLFLDLWTKEGIAQCFAHLADDGVLCVHTSHRFIDLPPVLAAIGKDLNLHVNRGMDLAPGNQRWRGGTADLAEVGHYTSEWVLLARRQSVLREICRTPANYEELLKKDELAVGRRREPYWTTPAPLDHVWTDKGPNLLHGILRGHPATMRYSAVATPCAEILRDVLAKFGMESPETSNLLSELSRLPRPIEDLLVQQQLKHNPQVERLWR